MAPEHGSTLHQQSADVCSRTLGRFACTACRPSASKGRITSNLYTGSAASFFIYSDPLRSFIPVLLQRTTLIKLHMISDGHNPAFVWYSSFQPYNILFWGKNRISVYRKHWYEGLKDREQTLSSGHLGLTLVQQTLPVGKKSSEGEKAVC